MLAIERRIEQHRAARAHLRVVRCAESYPLEMDEPRRSPVVTVLLVGCVVAAQMERGKLVDGLLPLRVQARAIREQLVRLADQLGEEAYQAEHGDPEWDRADRMADAEYDQWRDAREVA